MPDEDSKPKQKRRTRYTPHPTSDTLLSLTPLKWRALRLVADCRILSLPQLAYLLDGLKVRSRTASEKSARRQMRELFDAGLVDNAPVARAALATSEDANDETLLYGSAPNIYTPTTKGIKILVEASMVDASYLKRSFPLYGPINGLFLGHELMVRDVRVWMECLAVPHPGSEVLHWEDGPDAALPLPSGHEVRPDAWFVFRTGGAKNSPNIIGLIEADRRSDRNPQRWVDKVFYYTELFRKEGALEAATGYRNARVIVVTPDEKRRDDLAYSIAVECAHNQQPGMAARFWVASREHLRDSDLHSAVWHVAGTERLSPMLPRRE